MCSHCSLGAQELLLIDKSCQHQGEITAESGWLLKSTFPHRVDKPLRGSYNRDRLQAPWHTILIFKCKEILPSQQYLQCGTLVLHPGDRQSVPMMLSSSRSLAHFSMSSPAIQLDPGCAAGSVSGCTLHGK